MTQQSYNGQVKNCAQCNGFAEIYHSAKILTEFPMLSMKYVSVLCLKIRKSPISGSLKVNPLQNMN